MKSYFLTGYKCNLCFYMLQCIIVIIAGVGHERLSLVPLIGLLGYTLISFLVIFRGNKKRNLSERVHKELQSAFFVAINIITSLVFNSAQVFIYAMIYSSICLFIFLDTKLTSCHMLQSVISMVIVAVVLKVYVQSDQSMLEYSFGMIVVFVVNWVLVSMVNVIIFQNRVNFEQERSLDDLLKVVEAKRIEAQAATRSKSRFLANMSHEIRTPINSVMGMNEMILRESTEKDIRSYASEAKSAAEALLGIINDILDISKIEEGKLSIVPVRYNFPVFINDVYNLIRFRAEAKNLKFDVVVDKSLPKVLIGDDIRLKQVLINLLTNAVKYTKKGGIVLEIKRAEDDGIFFSVKDTGIGIREEDLSRLFNAFERIEEERNRDIEGTGLGLNITVTLLKMFGSSLEVKSTYGKGSEFYFVLKQKVVDPTPIGDVDLTAREEEYVEYSVDYEAPDAKVLLVDDNEINRKVFINLLKCTKVKVTEAENGLQSLELTKKNSYDIIFMDHMMPVMDGVQAFHEIRRREDNLCRNTPVIALTANAVVGAEDYYVSEGFDGFLTKPIDSVKLERTLFEKLDKSLLIEVASDGNGDKASDDSNLTDLPVIGGIDWSYGRLNLKDEDLLLSTIKMFFGSMRRDIEELNSYYVKIEEDGVLDSYRVKVHSMKSSANIIGIIQLSGMAMELEKAAKKGDLNVIKVMHPIYARCWLSYYEPLSEIVSSLGPEKTSEVDMDEIREIFVKIREAAENMDVDILDEMSEKLDGYSFEGELAQKIEEVKTMIFNFDVENLAVYEI